MVTMTTIITKDQDWLKKEIENGIDAFFETEHEYLVNLMMRYVYQQIYVSGCSLNIDNPVGESVKLHIVIDIPMSDECIDTIENISRRGVLSG